MKITQFSKRNIVLTMFTLISYLSLAQEDGFYVGGGWNTYFAKEEVQSSDGLYEFSHSSTSYSDGFLTQSLGDYGLGFSLGFRKYINTKDKEKNIITLDAQYYYNYQNVTLKSQWGDLSMITKAHYNHGYRVAIGHDFKKVHAYIIVQAFYQNITPYNSTINNEGVINDVEDDGTILTNQLDTDGNDFTNAVFSFLGGIGLEVSLNEKFKLHLEYIPMKHVEYGVRDVDNQDRYFVNNLIVNQMQIGLKYFFYQPFTKR